MPMRFAAALALLPVPHVFGVQRIRQAVVSPCSLDQDAHEEQEEFVDGRRGLARSCRSYADHHGAGPGASAPPPRGVDYLSFVQTELPRSRQLPGSVEGDPAEDVGRLSVWVNGYPRSGSSTILSMVAAADSEKLDSRTSGKTFSLFEPCHDGDIYEPWLQDQGCGGLLKGLTSCDFKGIQSLWGWPDSHTTSDHRKYSSIVAQHLCSRSRIVAFKTVDYGHNISAYRDFVDASPQLRILDIVRDPRGIYASWKTTPSFANLIGNQKFYTLTQVCETFASNFDLHHPNVHHVIFEELTQRPKDTMEKVFNFLGVPFGEAQVHWLNRTFDAPDCPTPKEWEVGYTDCHQNSKAVVDKWKEVLSAAELEEFSKSAACRQVAQAYNYPLEQ